MKSNKPQVILILMFVLLFLIVLSIVLNLRKGSVENFQGTPTQQAGSQNLFENTHEFVDYAKNSDKLLDMFKSLEEAEKKCEVLEGHQLQREEKQQMRENDRIFKELQEQDKKINEKDLSPKDIFQLVSNIRTRVLPNHLTFPNVGSFFKNIQLKQEEYNDLNLSSDVPIFIKDNIVKIPSAYLIDKAGWKGYREGGIGISDQHALVLIAYEETSGNEILNFAHKIIDDVFSKTKIKLEIEPSVI